jgi:hypothetical protein
MNTDERDRQRRKQLMLLAVQDQMNSPETPDVRRHYERLRALGHSETQAQELIATVLSFYIWHTMRQDGYTYSDYVSELARLPEIHWQTEDDNDFGSL